MFTDRFRVYRPSVQSRLQFLTCVDQRSLTVALNRHSCTLSARFKEAASGVCKVGALGYFSLFSQLHFIVPAGGLPQDAWTSVGKNAFTCLSGGASRGERVTHQHENNPDFPVRLYVSLTFNNFHREIF